MKKKNEELAKTIGTIIILEILINLTIASFTVLVALWFLGIFWGINPFILFISWYYYNKVDVEKNEDQQNLIKK